MSIQNLFFFLAALCGMPEEKFNTHDTIEKNSQIELARQAWNTWKWSSNEEKKLHFCAEIFPKETIKEYEMFLDRDDEIKTFEENGSETEEENSLNTQDLETVLKNPEQVYSLLFEETKYYCKKFYDYMSKILDDLTDKHNKYDCLVLLQKDLLSYTKKSYLNTIKAYHFKKTFRELPAIKHELIESIKNYLQRVDTFYQMIQACEPKNHKQFLLNLENIIFFETLYSNFSNIHSYLRDSLWDFKNLIDNEYRSTISKLVLNDIQKIIKNYHTIEKQLSRRIDHIIKNPLFNYIKVHYEYVSIKNNKNYPFIRVSVLIKPILIEDETLLEEHFFSQTFYIDITNKKVLLHENMLRPPKGQEILYTVLKSFDNEDKL